MRVLLVEDDEMIGANLQQALEGAGWSVDWVRVLDWIENNLGHDLHLDEVARRSGYSRWHLQRLFRQHTGFSLAEYIRNRSGSTRR